MEIITNHIGYEKSGHKKAFINAPEDAQLKEFNIKNDRGEIVYSGKIIKSGRVDNWRNFFFWKIDFSPLRDSGIFSIEVISSDTCIASKPFEIGEAISETKTLSNVIFHFKTQRSSGRFEQADHSIPFFDDRKNKIDVHGGWYDASGDTSKYLSHLSYANYYNPQQTPLVVWSLLSSYDLLASGKTQRQIFLNNRILDEATFGGDFLVRMKDKAGYFYTIVFDQWSKDLGKRMISSFSTQSGIRSDDYQAGYRQGGGLSIAALARLSTHVTFGDYSSSEYLQTAIDAFNHLELHNIEYLDDKKENIIDDYCALLAASELYISTSKDIYRKSADVRADNLCDRLSSGFGKKNWWRADDKGERPFYHASDAGLPVISLLRYLEIENSDLRKQSILDIIRKSLEFELKITSSVNNPFGYARQFIKAVDESPRDSFFIPHHNETGYWWQGENARIASLASAALLASKYFRDTDLSTKLNMYAIDQIYWIQGLNPFDVCMLFEMGRNSVNYTDHCPNAPGGICNGITSGFEDEHDIAFLPEKQKNDTLQNWRWGEQWLPHAAWYSLAAAAITACLSKNED